MKRTLGVQWQPIPVNLCAELSKLRHERSSPAPRAVVYLWLWHMMNMNAEVSIREVARYAGWGRWKAEQIRKQVMADIAAWKAKPDAFSHPVKANQPPTSKPPPMILDSCGPSPADPPDDTRQAPDDHARDNKELQLNNSIITQQKKEPLSSWKPTWEQIKIIYGSNVPGAKPDQLVLGESRKKAVRARISEYGAETVVKVTRWVYTSRHDRATFVRENGTLDTIFRASKFPQYLEFMTQEKNRAQAEPITFSKPARVEKKSVGWTNEEKLSMIARAKAELEEMKDIFTENQFEKAILVEATRIFGESRAK